MDTQTTSPLTYEQLARAIGAATLAEPPCYDEVSVTDALCRFLGVTTRDEALRDAVSWVCWQMFEHVAALPDLTDVVGCQMLIAERAREVAYKLDTLEQVRVCLGAGRTRPNPRSDGGYVGDLAVVAYVTCIDVASDVAMEMVRAVRQAARQAG